LVERAFYFITLWGVWSGETASDGKRGDECRV